MTLKKILPNTKKNVLLKNYTTLKIGGKAKYFFVAKSKKDLIRAVRTAKKFKLPFFVLGGGSNILINDKGFNGLVIKNEARDLEIRGKRIIAESGAILSKIIDRGIKRGLSGLEKGSGIPGTVGGAVYGNAGWPRGDWSIGDLVEKVEILWPKGKIEKVGKRWLSFDYRNSRFKKIKINKPVILEVILKLKKGKIANIKKKQLETLEIRRKKIPAGFSIGSIFKNPPKNPAGFLIEKCGLKGKRFGNVQISEKHANFIINLGNGKANDVKKLINLVKNKVKKRFKVLLREEIRYVGP